MPSVVITPTRLSGAVIVPPSKSVSHRAVIARWLAGGEGTLRNIELSDDIKATIRCINGDFDCGESGSTLRFMIPLALLRSETATFTGSARLLERPLDSYEKLFEVWRGEGNVMVKGKLKTGIFELDGGTSSQFVTGLMFALPLLNGDSEIVMSIPLASKPYVDLTLSVLKDFGIEIVNNGYKSFQIKGGQSYKPCDYTVEGDYSQAAFWLVANALGSKIKCEGMNPLSRQGDKAILDIISDGRRVIDVTDIPDLAPILTVLCCFRDGESRIIGAARLRTKESDRLNTITTELNKLGGNVTELEDGLIINGVSSLRGAEVYSHNDHRIAMSLAIAATRCEGKVTIRGAECVAKSYPNFFKHYESLGGVIK